jgi:hypothetical protein
LLNILPLENATWTNFQRAVVDHDLLLDRWPFGLQSASQEPFVKDIALSPDLQTADVILEIPYHINNKGQLQTIRLQHTHHYQFRNNWHWSEPDVAYWGGLGHEIYEKGSFTALYPARDEAIVQRLIDDLSAYSTGYFAGICGSNDQPPCSFALDILLYFEKEPGIWLDMESRLEENGSYISSFSPSSIRSNALFFPTPSLVGLPVDGAAGRP